MYRCGRSPGAAAVGATSELDGGRDGADFGVVPVLSTGNGSVLPELRSLLNTSGVLGANGPVLPELELLLFKADGAFGASGPVLPGRSALLKVPGVVSGVIGGGPFQLEVVNGSPKRTALAGGPFGGTEDERAARKASGGVIGSAGGKRVLGTHGEAGGGGIAESFGPG